MPIAEPIRKATKGTKRAWRRARKLRRTVSAGYWEQARGGLAPSWEHQHLADLAVDVIIDVGANRGQFTLLAHRLFPTARIIAFEPIPSAAATYQRFAPDPAELQTVALADIDGNHQLNICAADHSSSLLPVAALQRQLFSGTDIVEIIDVEVRRLDSIIEPSDLESSALLKIDVQGTELAVLQGCGDLLPSFRYVYVECSFVELYEGQALAGDVLLFLSAAGFVLRRMANSQADKSQRCVQADFLFERAP